MGMGLGVCKMLPTWEFQKYIIKYLFHLIIDNVVLWGETHQITNVDFDVLWLYSWDKKSATFLAVFP